MRMVQQRNKLMLNGSEVDIYTNFPTLWRCIINISLFFASC